VMIYDADTDEVVAITDGTDDADLAYLSLESEDYEYVESVKVVVVEHGGALPIWLIAGLGFAAYRRFKV
ncbi:MAG: GlyGly-CTERM sorting domain-containing protein, partial [Glaciecola sp.]